MAILTVSLEKPFNDTVLIQADKWGSAHEAVMFRREVFAAWDTDIKRYRLSIYNVDLLRNHINKHGHRLRIASKEDYEPMKEKIDAIKGKSPKSIDSSRYQPALFKHQVEGIQFGLINNEIFIFDEQGTGKTRQAIELMKLKSKGMRLIICPKSVRGVWRDQLKEYAGADELQIHMIQRDNYRGLGSIYTIVNYEMLRIIIDKIPIDLLDFVVIDEVHRCKNRDTQTHKAIRKLKDVKYKILMTGTPFANRMEDLYAIHSLARNNVFGSWADFVDNFVILGGYGGTKVIDYKNAARINFQSSKVSIRRLKKDVLDLPPKTYQSITFDLTSPEMKMYIDIREEIAIWAEEYEKLGDKFKTINNLLVRMLRLSQVADGRFLIDISKYPHSSSKTDTIIDLIRDMDKVIIWSRFVDMAKVLQSQIRKHLKEEALIMIGETRDRDEVIKKFEKDRRFLISNPRVGGLGVSYHFASKMVYADNSFSFIDRKQSEDRCHRIGQVNPLTIYDIIANGTIDEYILTALSRKGRLSDVVIDRHDIKDILEGRKWEK